MEYGRPSLRDAGSSRGDSWHESSEPHNRSNTVVNQDIPDSVSKNEGGIQVSKRTKSFEPKNPSRSYGWIHESNEDAPDFSVRKSDLPGSRIYPELREEYGLESVNKSTYVCESSVHTETTPSKNSHMPGSETGASSRENTTGEKVVVWYHLYIYWLLAGALVCMFTVAHLSPEPLSDTQTAIKEVAIPLDQIRASNFRRQLPVLIERYRGQHLTTWAKVLSAVDAVFDNSTVPHVLVLTGNADNKDKLFQFAMDLHRSFSKAFGVEKCHPVDGNAYSRTVAGNQFFDTVETCLGKHSVLIHDLDKIHGEVAMHLHAFADNENAPFKTSALYLTMVSDCHINIEKCLKDLAMEKWGSEVDEDRISSLNSRIFNVAVQVV